MINGGAGAAQRNIPQVIVDGNKEHQLKKEESVKRVRNGGEKEKKKNIYGTFNKALEKVTSTMET